MTGQSLTLCEGEFLPKPMIKIKRERTLKVCRTCRFWSNNFKGVCTRREQGVGQFWVCEDWAGQETERERAAAPETAPIDSE